MGGERVLERRVRARRDRVRGIHRGAGLAAGLRARRGLRPEREEAVVIRAAVAVLQLTDDAERIDGPAGRRVGEREAAAHVHRGAVVLRGRVLRFEQRDRVVDATELQQEQPVRRVVIAVPDLLQLGIARAQQRGRVVGMAVLQEDVRLHDVGDVLHPFRRKLGGDLAHPDEHGLRLLAFAELGQRADHRCRRLDLAPAVVDVLEELHRVPTLVDRLAGAAAPERDVGEEHVHHADGPAVAGLEPFDRDLFRELGGFVEAALHVADEGEEAERPTQTAPVAELAEQLGALLQAALGGRRVAAGERDPGDVLQRPRLAATVAFVAVRGERFGDRARRPR